MSKELTPAKLLRRIRAKLKALEPMYRHNASLPPADRDNTLADLGERQGLLELLMQAFPHLAAPEPARLVVRRMLLDPRDLRVDVAVRLLADLEVALEDGGNATQLTLDQLLRRVQRKRECPEHVSLSNASERMEGYEKDGLVKLLKQVRRCLSEMEPVRLTLQHLLKRTDDPEIGVVFRLLTELEEVLEEQAEEARRAGQREGSTPSSPDGRGSFGPSSGLPGPSRSNGQPPSSPHYRPNRYSRHRSGHLSY
jgi:hypothetical protein